MKNKFVKIGIILLLFVVGCSSALYIPNSDNLVLQKELSKGRELYISHCSNCHSLYLPRDFTNEQWKDNLNMMQVHSKITDKEKEMIYKYLTSAPNK